MSAKTSTPGRRTPLSLTGSAIKGQSNKGGGSNAASNSGNNANGHSTANSNKQDNKLQQQKTEQQRTNNTDTKENPNNNKKAHQQSEKKQQQQQQQNDNNKKSIEKNQNGINNNSSKQHQQQANENKQSQQQSKDSKQQNGNDNKLNENNDKKEKPEKEQDKIEKVETKAKEDKKSELEKQENNKKEEKKTKEVKDSKDTKKADKNETANRVVDESAANELHEKSDDKNLKDEKDGQVPNPKSEGVKNDSMEVVEEQQQSQQKSPPSTPKANKANKSSTALNKTPTEKTPQKMTFSIATSQITKREVTTAIDDVDMEPLAVEGSPVKTTQPEEVGNLNIAPSATSTPGKILLSKRHSAAPKSEVQLAMQSSAYTPERPRVFSQISGRKSIRPITDYTPSKFHSNSQFRESYRRINTELDITNTSINVTVGSEVPSNLSFSFFGRGRKRERTPPQLSQSAIGELHTDVEVSPPKKARLEGFFSVVSSPLTLLRNRFSKATLQSSTPVNLQQKLNAAEDEIEVQNVSGLSVHEDLSKTEKEAEMSVASNNEVDGDTGEAKSNSAIKEVLEDKDCNDVSLKSEISCGAEQSCEASDIKITETLLKPAVGDPLNKNKRCIVM